jgi:hypothetical protein
LELSGLAGGNVSVFATVLSPLLLQAISAVITTKASQNFVFKGFI